MWTCNWCYLPQMWAATVFLLTQFVSLEPSMMFVAQRRLSENMPWITRPAGGTHSRSHMGQLMKTHSPPHSSYLQPSALGGISLKTSRSWPGFPNLYLIYQYNPWKRVWAKGGRQGMRRKKEMKTMDAQMQSSLKDISWNLSKPLPINKAMNHPGSTAHPPVSRRHPTDLRNGIRTEFHF